MNGRQFAAGLALGILVGYALASAGGWPKRDPINSDYFVVSMLCEDSRGRAHIEMLCSITAGCGDEVPDACRETARRSVRDSEVHEWMKMRAGR